MVFLMSSNRTISSTHYDGPRPRLDRTGDFRLWQQQVQRALQGLRRVGHPADPAAPVSLQQALRELYGDSQFAAFISSRAWEQAGLNGHAGEELLKLQQHLDAFEEPDSDEDLADDREWQCIMAQVVAVTALLG